MILQFYNYQVPESVDVRASEKQSGKHSLHNGCCSFLFYGLADEVENRCGLFLCFALFIFILFLSISSIHLNGKLPEVKKYLYFCHYKGREMNNSGFFFY